MKLCCEFRATNRGHFVRFYFREEAVAATRNSFYKAGTFGGVAKGLTDFVDSFIEPVVEIDKGVLRPEFFLKFLASYDLAGALNQHRQELEGLFLKANPQAVLAQFASAKIQLENAKTERPAKPMGFFHGEESDLKGSVPPRAVMWTTKRGESPVSLLLSASYQGTPIPAGENCPSIAPLLGANHSEALKRTGNAGRSLGGFSARTQSSPEF